MVIQFLDYVMLEWGSKSAIGNRRLPAHAYVCVCVCMSVCMYAYIYIYIIFGIMIQKRSSEYQSWSRNSEERVEEFGRGTWPVESMSRASI